MSETKIYHNPKCSKSRQTLELIRGRGIEPEIILYLEGLLTSEDIASIIEMLKIRPLEIIRKNEADFKEYFAAAGHLNDEQLIKLATIIQRIESAAAKGETSELFDFDGLQDLLDDSREIEEEVDNISGEEKDEQE